MFEIRPGETRLDNDPAITAKDASLIFIGQVRSAWTKRANCPKNMRQARERGKTAKIVIDQPFREGLSGLEVDSAIILLTWLGHAPRDLIVQKPRHAETPKGTFALRSPARPNPIGLHVVRLCSIEPEAGVLIIDAIDVLDETPLLDIKPWFATTDVHPEE
ncbi:MAG: tRNA (N6-threonylcarbamoyladenosine(37)-N6)-methyltransferase TrmO [Rhizobiaceae bacterium]